MSYQASSPGDHRDIEPPDPISNSEVKSAIADDSVGFPHVKVGHHQVIIRKARSIVYVAGFFYAENKVKQKKQEEPKDGEGK